MSNPDYVFDLLRGVAAYTGDRLVAALARTVAAHPEAGFDVAFNHKQVACKMWARDELHRALGGRFASVWVLGGWYGVLPALLFADRRFDIGSITSIDIDDAVAAVASTLNGELAGPERFRVVTADMYDVAYHGAERPDLVVNTSCEHIADLRAWLDLLPSGTAVLLQSNDYVAEPTHINCMADAVEFAAAARLTSLIYAGELKLPRYTRFMVIGRV